MCQRRPESISAFFPVYNDARSIGKLVAEASAVLQRNFDRWEIILVNDGSEDDSAQVLDRLAASDSRIRTVHHPRNRGYGAALNSGFLHSTGDLVFYTDGDAQYDPAELELLLDRLDGADMVNGFKLSRSDHAVRIFEGRLYQTCSRILFGLTVRDVDCDFRLFRRHVVEAFMPLRSVGGTVGAEILSKVHDQGFKIAQTPVHHYPRPYGHSQFFRAPRIAHAVLELHWYWLYHVLVRRTSCRRVTGKLALIGSGT
ncbi:MAG: glycosyltransferase family 2 protein [Planctomycetota bacterium]